MGQTPKISSGLNEDYSGKWIGNDIPAFPCLQCHLWSGPKKLNYILCFPSISCSPNTPKDGGKGFGASLRKYNAFPQTSRGGGEGKASLLKWQNMIFWNEHNMFLLSQWWRKWGDNILETLLMCKGVISLKDRDGKFLDQIFAINLNE